MKKIIFPLFLLAIIGIAFFLWSKESQAPISSSSQPASEEITHGKSPSEEYIIVPYWALDSDVSSAPFENLMYFGISANENGIEKDEEGYTRLSSFTDLTATKNTYLIVRMLDNDSNFKVLEDKASQDKIINESIVIAKSYGFEGIVLDLEIQGIPFESFVSSITNFNNKFSSVVKKNNLSFGTFIYGDVYFRARPFNLSEIGKTVDRVFVMAYDFSKARGNPGPNFPFDEEDKYGYSFKRMIRDFESEVPKEKITVVFGMFGYDWLIDEQGRGKATAISKSTFQFQRFLTQCISENKCKAVQNPSSETQITYKDETGDHEIWYENESSVEKKIEYLKSQGINSIGYWAYSYF